MFCSRENSFNLLEYHVVTTNEQPVYPKPYQIQHSMRNELKKMFAMFEDEVLQLFLNNSPMLLKLKRDKSSIFCIDNRNLNQTTQRVNCSK